MICATGIFCSENTGIENNPIFLFIISVARLKILAVVVRIGVRQMSQVSVNSKS